MLKRVPKNFSLNSHSIHHSSIKINRESYLVYNGMEEISLQKKQFELLYLLISNPKKTFSRDELYQTVWKNKEVTNPRIIDVHIRKLREKIGENLIVTVKGNGYKIAS
jgi:two-component system alkaline phosphatase synthesis response regulator PhoP